MGSFVELGRENGSGFKWFLGLLGGERGVVG